jgi:hypothetical protein
VKVRSPSWSSSRQQCDKGAEFDNRAFARQPSPTIPWYLYGTLCKSIVQARVYAFSVTTMNQKQHAGGPSLLLQASSCVRDATLIYWVLSLLIMPRSSPDRTATRNESKDETKDLAGRVFGQYLEACRQLEVESAKEIASLASKVLVDAPEAVRRNPRDAVFWALQATYTTASDASASPIDRRQCFTTLTTMLGRIDKVKGQPSREQSSRPAETRPAAERLSPEHRAVMPAQESSREHSDEPVRGKAVASSHRSLENNLPQKRPAESQVLVHSARADPALNENGQKFPHRPSSPSPLVTSPLNRATSPTTPQPKPPPPPPPPANRAQHANIQTGVDVPPTSAASAVSKRAATDPTATNLSDKPPPHALGDSEPLDRRREVSLSESSSGKQPSSIPNGDLKPPARQQTTDPAPTGSLPALAELRKARDLPKSSDRSTQNARQSAADASSATSAAAEQQKASSEMRDGTSASRSRSPEHPTVLSVPRKSAASPTVTASGDGPSVNARTGPGSSADAESQVGNARSLLEPSAAATARLSSAAPKDVNGSRGPGADSVAASIPESDRPGYESGNRQTTVAAAPRSEGGRDRETLFPSREREPSITRPQGREQSARHTGPRNGVSSHDKSDLMFLCLQKYGSSETAERKSFVAQPDTNRFSGALEERDRVKLEFEQTSVNMTEALAMMDRLQRWDPFWEFTGPVMIGKLGRILVPALETPPPEGTALNEAYKAKAEKLAKSGKLLRTAMRLVFTPNVDLKAHGERDVFKLIPFPSWHNPQRTTFENGEAHLILRMLPCNPPTQGTGSASSYRTRVDCHIWPKGTFLQHNGNPVRLRQRKLDKGNRTWKHSDPKELHVLDLTPRIQDPRTEQVLDLCCYDDEPFLYCLSICRYRSHEALYRSLTLSSSPERLEMIPYDAGLARIIELANPVLLDGVEETDPGGDNFAYYSLLCPLTMKTMSHPVRGRKCSHFQVRAVFFDWGSAHEIGTAIV